MNTLTLTQVRGEARIDSRLLAEQLGIQHKNAVSTIRRYEVDFREIGTLAFETRKSAGMPVELALLNEDQCYLLLSYSRNTSTVRALKIGLVKAFREVREHTTITDTQYLPLYHSLHDEVAQLAKRAHDCGSDAPERVFHMNANRALNAAMGLAKGERSTLTIGQRLMLTTLQAIYTRALHASIQAGDGHKEAGHKAKSAALEFVENAGHLLIGSAAA